jgi:hypothetical protein
MMWLFNIITDGTHKARLVARGDQMIPYIDFDSNAVYCDNVSACSTKIAAKIAATYQLVKRDGDIVGAYLVTRTSPDFKWYIQTPQGYKINDGEVIEAVGNIYGAPTAAASQSAVTRTHRGISSSSTSGSTTVLSSSSHTVTTFDGLAAPTRHMSGNFS